MTTYIIRRLTGAVLNLVLVSVFVFFLLAVMPGDVSASFIGVDARPEQIEEWREANGLNRPLPVRYVEWAKGFLTGDMGTSFRSNRPVVDEFKTRLPVTLEIVLIGITITVAFGITGGIISAMRQNSTSDYSIRLLAVAGLSIPNFLLLTLLLILPAKFLGYAPPFSAVGFLENPRANLELFVPATALLAVSSSAGLVRLTRSAFLEVLRQDYMRTARAKGLSERVITMRHALRNALPPILTLAALQLVNLLGGSIILESIMGLPGLGVWTLTAISGKDYPIVMAVAIYTAAVLMAVNLIVDLTYAWIDPRIRYS